MNLSKDCRPRSKNRPKPTGKTMSVPEAGWEYLGLSKNAAYEAVRLGVIPVIKIGARMRVPVLAMERMLEAASAPTAAQPDA